MWETLLYESKDSVIKKKLSFKNQKSKNKLQTKCFYLTVFRHESFLQFFYNPKSHTEVLVNRQTE